MLYSASRRTDMPAFFPDRIVEKVRRSRKLQGMVLWTKDVRNLVNYPGLAEVLERLPCLVHYTVTGLAGTVWEPRVPPLADQRRELALLGERLPPGAVNWRFDPVIATVDLRERFERVKAELASLLPLVDGVTVSFPDPYRKAVARVAAAGLQWPAVSDGEKRAILSWMAASFGDGADGRVRLCCEPLLLAVPGTAMARCIDGAAFDRLYGLGLGELPKDFGQRKACGCVSSTDIGGYDLRCGHGCLYCYANPDL